MNSNRHNIRESNRQDSSDLLVDLDLTPPASPQTSRSPKDSNRSQSTNMQQQAYYSHRGHQSLDAGRKDWRSQPLSRAFGGLSLRNAGGGPGSSGWSAFPNAQRNPRYTPWRNESPPNAAVTEGQPPYMVRANGHGAIVTPVTPGPYAYCLDRGNGQVTRLIPADMLPPLEDIPPQEPARPGLSVLPAPMAPSPRDIPPTNQSVAVKYEAATSAGSTARHSAISSPHKPVKEKIYCSKWIHDGNCAFEWAGCRYKHEMPMDRDMQRELGLFNGLPAWWKKRQLQFRQQARQSMEAPGNSRLAGSVPDDLPKAGFGSAGSEHGSALVKYNPGPIAPPRKYK